MDSARIDELLERINRNLEELRLARISDHNLVSAARREKSKLVTIQRREIRQRYAKNGGRF